MCNFEKFKLDLRDSDDKDESRKEFVSRMMKKYGKARATIYRWISNTYRSFSDEKPA